MYDRLKEAAHSCGYALAIHGSMHKDFDLIAVPWIQEAKSPEELIQAIVEAMGDTIYASPDVEPTVQSHGRTSHAISWGPFWFVDLSIMERSK
jgi:hypothetical protein